MTIEQWAAKITVSVLRSIGSIAPGDSEKIEQEIKRDLAEFAAEIGEAYRQQKGRMCDD